MFGGYDLMAWGPPPYMDEWDDCGITEGGMEFYGFFLRGWFVREGPGV